MELPDAITLIDHQYISSPALTNWADLGCGTGLFTTALTNVLAPKSIIYAIDNDTHALQKVIPSNQVAIKKIKADFVKDDLNLPLLDGILMANSLHFIKNKISLLNKLSAYQKQDGCFLIIEYDMDTPNQWVPYPLSYPSLRQLFSESGYASINKIHELPSRYNRANIYSVLVQH